MAVIRSSGITIKMPVRSEKKQQNTAVLQQKVNAESNVRKKQSDARGAGASIDNNQMMYNMLFSIPIIPSK